MGTSVNPQAWAAKGANIIGKERWWFVEKKFRQILDAKISMVSCDGYGRGGQRLFRSPGAGKGRLVRLGHRGGGGESRTKVPPLGRFSSLQVQKARGRAPFEKFLVFGPG